MNHIDLTKTTISTANGAEMVTKPTVNFQEGWDRKRQIEAERERELAAHRQRLEDANPLNMRILKLEAAVGQLQEVIKQLTKDGSSR